MSGHMTRRWLLLPCIILLVGCTAASPPATPSSPPGSPTPTADKQPPPIDTPTPHQLTKRVQVIEVIDGDTIDIEYPNGSTERVRLLGIDTPEIHVETEPSEFEGVPDSHTGKECLRAMGDAATERVKTRLAGEAIRLAGDAVAPRRGGYDRLLAYVYHQGVNVNYWLVARGYARVFEAAFTQAAYFSAAENQAQAANRGVWQCQTDS